MGEQTDRINFPGAVVRLSRLWNVTHWWTLPLPKLIGKRWCVFVTRAERRPKSLSEREALDLASSMAAFIEPAAAAQRLPGEGSGDSEYELRLQRLIDSAVDGPPTSKHGNVIDYGPQFGEEEP